MGDKRGAVAVAEQTQFESLDKLDVTDVGCQLCWALTCPITYVALIPGVMGSKYLTMEDEEVILEYHCLGCCDGEKKMPYGELGNVEVSHVLCCVGVSSNLGPFFPGWGCDSARVVSQVCYLYSFHLLCLVLDL